MLWSPRKIGLTSLFKEVRVSKELSRGNFCPATSRCLFWPTGQGMQDRGEICNPARYLQECFMRIPRKCSASAFGVLVGVLPESTLASAPESARDIGSAPGSALESAFLNDVIRANRKFE